MCSVSCRSIFTVVVAAGVAASAIAFQPASQPASPTAKPVEKRSTVLTQPKEGKPAQPGTDVQAPPGMNPAEMEAMMKAAMPGPNHELMKKLSGAWEGDMKMWMAPGAPPQEMKMSVMGKMEMEGRYLTTQYTGTMMGMPFRGLSTMAYNNITKKFQSTWIDNMSTSISTSEGTYDEGSKTFTMKGKMDDPMSGKAMDTREVMKIEDDGKWMMEMYGPGPDGKEMKMMEIHFTRKGGPAAATPKVEPKGATPTPVPAAAPGQKK